MTCRRSTGMEFFVAPVRETGLSLLSIIVAFVVWELIILFYCLYFAQLSVVVDSAGGLLLCLVIASPGSIVGVLRLVTWLVHLVVSVPGLRLNFWGAVCRRFLE